MNAAGMLRGAHLRKEVQLGSVAGIVSTTVPMIFFLDRQVSGLDLITSKSIQEEATPGNREPVIVEPEAGCFGNAVGLRNPGYRQFLREYERHQSRHSRQKILALSIAASSPEVFVRLIVALAPVADIIELNLSCPHAKGGYGLAIGSDPKTVAEYFSVVRKRLPSIDALLFAKLSAVEGVDIAAVAKAAVDHGADGISAINTIGPRRYIETQSGHPILNNPPDGYGGMSGSWIRDHACVALTRVREALGPDVPVIGMGGVSTARDVAHLVDAGADLVGIGSVFGRVKQKDWARYISTLKAEATRILRGERYVAREETYLSKRAGMQYKPYIVERLVHHNDEYFSVEFEGALAAEAGQFVFLWMPGVGEKPFFISRGDKLSVCVRRRGPHTKALAALRPGERVFLRGPYGRWNTALAARGVFLLAEEAGIAPFPFIASTLSSSRSELTVFWQVEQRFEVPGMDSSKYYAAASIEDHLCSMPSAAVGGTALISGSENFLRLCVRLCVEKGIAQSRIFLLLERSTRCGIGICGECACAGILTCGGGCIVPYTRWSKEICD